MKNLTTEGFNITRTQNHTYDFRVTGLRPNTKHTINIDGEDFAYATRQFGKAPGADLITDDDGAIRLFVLYEIMFHRMQDFEIEDQPTLSKQTNIFNQQQSQRNTKVVNNYKIVELISFDGQSYSQFVLKLNLLLTPTAIKTLFH